MSDTINGLFESLGSLAVLLSIRQVWRDRAVQGVHWMTTAFFASWGYWNLYYYPALAQTLSTIGAASVAMMNTIYLGSLIYFSRRPESAT